MLYLLGSKSKRDRERKKVRKRGREGGREERMEGRGESGEDRGREERNRKKGEKLERQPPHPLSGTLAVLGTPLAVTRPLRTHCSH